MTDEIAFREKYLPLVKQQTPETLPAFIEELTNQELDYGTTCIAIGLAAAATAWSIENGPKGGLTGFMAGAVFWEFTRAWGSPTIGECGASFHNHDDLLYPQYDHKWNTISQSTFEALQKRAAELLAEAHELTHPDVLAHWTSITLGMVPFGLTLEDR